MNPENRRHAAIVLLSCFAFIACGGDDDGAKNGGNGLGGKSFESVLGGPGGAVGNGGTAKPTTNMTMTMRGVADSFVPQMAASAGAQCSASASDTVCFQCVVAECGPTCDSCASDPNCPDALSCIGECTTESCITSCGSQSTLTRVDNLLSCAQQRCLEYCADDSSGGATTAAGSCEACAQAECSPIREDCLRDRACVALAECCTGSDSECSQCVEASPDSAFQTLSALAECLTDCGCEG